MNCSNTVSLLVVAALVAFPGCAKKYKYESRDMGTEIEDTRSLVEVRSEIPEVLLDIADLQRELTEIRETVGEVDGILPDVTDIDSDIHDEIVSKGPLFLPTVFSGISQGVDLILRPMAGRTAP